MIEDYEIEDLLKAADPWPSALNAVYFNNSKLKTIICNFFYLKHCF